MNTLDWNGAAVIAQIDQAAAKGIDETTGKAADIAQQEHGWQPKSGELEDNIISHPAKQDGPMTITGRFGSTKRPGGFYGLFQERREPFLRPAADREFPQLGERIAENMD